MVEFLCRNYKDKKKAIIIISNTFKFYIKNLLLYINTYNIKISYSLMKYANVDIDTYYAENIMSHYKCGSAFILQNDAKIDIK